MTQSETRLKAESSLIDLLFYLHLAESAADQLHQNLPRRERLPVADAVDVNGVRWQLAWFRNMLSMEAPVNIMDAVEQRLQQRGPPP